MEKTFDLWQDELLGLPFEEYSLTIKNKILETNDIDERSKLIFSDCFDYVSDLYKKGKPLDTKLFYIHLTQVKGYKGLSFNEFVLIIILLGFCGFLISNIN